MFGKNKLLTISLINFNVNIFKPKTHEMKNLIKISILSGLLILFFAFSIKAVERESAPANNTSQAKTEISNPVQPAIPAVNFKNMSFKEKFKMLREIKKEIKKSKKIKKGTPKVILYILAVILPPVAVGIFTDWGEPTLWNLLFTLLFWIPGIIHAFYILLR